MNEHILTGKRISLELLDKKHLEKRVLYLNDPDVQKTLSFDYPTSLSKTEAWFAKNVLSDRRVDFALNDRVSSNVIGFGGLINIDHKSKKAELYIFIGDKSFWGKGFGRDGYKLLVNYGFYELGLNKIYLYQQARNVRAIKATQALGWYIEGLLRKDIWSHGELIDQYILSILRSEWELNEDYRNV